MKPSGARPTVALRERAVEWTLMGAGLASIAVTVAIVGVLLAGSLKFFARVPLRAFLFDLRWAPLFETPSYGIWPLVSGTVLTSAIALAVALPLGVLAAIYLSEYASGRARRLLKPGLEILAGVPTIVYGYFALVWLTPALQRVIPGLGGFNALSPGIVMGVMIVPLVASLGEDALAAVPDTLREAAYALGAGKLPTIVRVVLPAAASGVASAAVIAVSRAVGETMIVTIAAGQQPRLTLDPRDSVETMTAFIVKISLGDVAAGSLAYDAIFVVGGALFLLTFAANLTHHRLLRGSGSRWWRRGGGRR